MKSLLLAASLALVAAGVSSCGGDAPTKAAEEDFCEAFTSLFADVPDSPDVDEADAVQAFRDWGERLEEVGTPEDMGEQARAGFERTLEVVRDLDEGVTLADFDSLGEDLPAQAQEQVEAFDAYAFDTCGNPLDDVSLPEVPELPGLE